MTSALIMIPVMFLYLAALMLTEAWATAGKSRSIRDVLSGQGHLQVLNSKHIAGILLFITACWYYPGLPGTFQPVFEPAWNSRWSFACLVIAAIAGVAGCKTAEKIVPTQLSGSPGKGEAVVYVLIRVSFLVLYECFFRGVMLFTMMEATNMVIAILWNVTLYAAAHVFSDRKEFFGTIPFGLLLCMLTLLHHSVWPAIIIHLALALSYECSLLLKKQPPIKSWKL